MEKLFLESNMLLKYAGSLNEMLNGKNPSLANIAADAGELAYRYNNLRVDILRLHERNQLNDS